jgi:hypothetical protein
MEEDFEEEHLSLEKTLVPQLRFVRSETIDIPAC